MKKGRKLNPKRWMGLLDFSFVLSPCPELNCRNGNVKWQTQHSSDKCPRCFGTGFLREVELKP